MKRLRANIMLRFSLDKEFPINLSTAIILCFSLINGAIGIPGISLFTLIVIAILILLSVSTRSVSFHQEMLLIVVFVSLVFALSFLCVRDKTFTKEYFLYFAGYCIITMFVGMQKIDIERVLSFTSLIGLICVLIMILRRGIETYDASLQMGISYSMLPVLVSSFILIKKYRKCIACSIANIFLIFNVYSKYAPRGTWLVLGIFFISSALVLTFTRKNTAKSKAKKIFLLIICFIALLLVIYDFTQILIAINNMYQSFTGKRIYSIDKYVFLLNQGDVSNGRALLWEKALETIKLSPIFGNGIGYYESVAGGYTHNIILQSLCEAGLFFAIPVLVLILRSIYLLFLIAKNDEIEFYYYGMIFTNGIVILLYSSVYWKLFIFWYLIGYVTPFRNKSYYY